jgi:hypothetical protein
VIYSSNTFWVVLSCVQAEARLVTGRSKSAFGLSQNFRFLEFPCLRFSAWFRPVLPAPFQFYLLFKLCNPLKGVVFFLVSLFVCWSIEERAAQRPESGLGAKQPPSILTVFRGKNRRMRWQSFLVRGMAIYAANVSRNEEIRALSSSTQQNHTS